MSDVQAILYYSFKIYESEKEYFNRTCLHREWMGLLDKKRIIIETRSRRGKHHPCATPESLSLFVGKTVNPSLNSRVSQKLHRNPIPVRVKNGHRDGDDWRVNERKDSFSIVAVFTDEIVLAVRKQKAKEKHRGNEEEKDSNFLVRRHFFFCLSLSAVETNRLNARTEGRLRR